MLEQKDQIYWNWFNDKRKEQKFLLKINTNTKAVVKFGNRVGTEIVSACIKISNHRYVLILCNKM